MMAQDTKSLNDRSWQVLTATGLLGSGIEHRRLTTHWLTSVTFAPGAVTTAQSAERSWPRTWIPRMPWIDPRPNGTVSNQPPTD